MIDTCPTCQHPIPSPTFCSDPWHALVLKRLRLAARLTQVQAALLMGVTVRTWQRWEAGEVPMRPVLFEAFRYQTQQELPKWPSYW